MNRAERERIAVETRRGLRDAAARARRGAEQVADMRKATAGSTHPDAIRVQKLLALADRAPTHAERKECLRSAWDYAKDYANSRGSSKGGTTAAAAKKQRAADWKAKIKPKILRFLAAGKTDPDIAGRTYIEAGRKLDTVRKFVAEVRKAWRKK